MSFLFSVILSMTWHLFSASHNSYTVESQLSEHVETKGCSDKDN